MEMDEGMLLVRKAGAFVQKLGLQNETDFLTDSTGDNLGFQFMVLAAIYMDHGHWAVGLVLTVVCIGMAVCVYRKKLRIIQALAVVALVVFLGIVFGSTVFTRIGTVRQYELLPFWSWREVICNHDRELLKENLLNFILLLPAGILLPLIANHKIKWYQALLIGILMSATIELSQLIFMRGLFEWDDMIHNGLGCMAGCLFTNFFVKSRVKH